MRAPRSHAVLAVLVAAVGCTGGGATPSPDGGAAPVGDAAAGSSPFATRVVSFEPGAGAGFGQEDMPDIVLGPPHGAGDAQGSLDVVSLGTGGEIVLELGRAATDGPGPDLVVFENAFVVGTITFAEPGIVAVSDDGESWATFPCDPEASPDYPGCAGVSPVYADPDENDIDPTDPAAAGGDAFDLADVGLERARFVRIRDAGGETGLGGESEGFDLDALAVL